MFHWNQSNAPALSEELFGCESVREIKIATAYLSGYGIQMLRRLQKEYGLKKERIVLYLSAEFSSISPHEQLEQLSEICTTKIITDRMFHAKVYWLRGQKDKLLYGSSNFTEGGFEKNIEFDSVTTPTTEEQKSLAQFFAYCDSIGISVTPDMVEYYLSQQAELQQLQTSQKKLRKILHGYKKGTDAFDPEDYDLSGYYFTFQDYETFFDRNQQLDNADIRKRRKAVQDKMLRIHNDIYPSIKRLGIACHRREDNITSLVRPCIYNKYHVGWLGVRYGKTPKELDALNFGGEKDDVLGFQKHGCLQFSVVPNGFEVNLFFAVRHDAVDRWHLQEKFSKLRTRIESEMKKLKGYGMQWVIFGEGMDQEEVYDFDKEPVDQFYEYFKEHDRDGCESYLRIFYPPDDENIKDIDTLENKIVETMKLLLPLYNAMVFRIKG